MGVTVDHGLHDLTAYARAAEDVAAAVALVRADPRVDADRVALWFFSGGGLLAADWLAAPPPWLRCVAASYPVLAPLPGWNTVDARFRPVDAVRTAGELPVVLTRAGLEHAPIAATVAEFLAAAAPPASGSRPSTSRTATTASTSPTTPTTPAAPYGPPTARSCGTCCAEHGVRGGRRP